MADKENNKESGGIKQLVAEMPMGRRLIILGVAAALMAGFISLILYVNQPSYQVLFSGMGSNDAGQVVEKLKELKVPYQIDGNGSIIKVPADQVYETRLALATAGLPKGAGVGFEVFNEVQMGTTEFVQKINYQRALQGELARTIADFREVDEARVHIVLPRESLFVEDEKKPSAGVVLKLAAGRRLDQNQIAGIVHLVASAVPDLTDDRVTIVDTSGNLLYRKEADTAGFPGAMTAGQLDYQHNLENAVRGKAQSMLEQVLGPGRAVVRVSADVDFTRTVTTEDIINPDQVAVRSETSSVDKTEGGGNAPTGSPDQRYNLAQKNANPASNNLQSSTSSENTTTNFEMSRTQRQINQPVGGVKKLNVAVVVDGPYKTSTTAEGVTTRTFEPRSAEQMRQLTELVQRAVGYDQARGDQVTVANVPFQMPTEVGTAAAVGWQDYLETYGRPALTFVLAVLFFLMVVRPLMKTLTARMAPKALTVSGGAPVPAGMGVGEPRRVGPGEALGAGDDEDRALLEDMDKPRKITVKDQILALAQRDPERTTAVLRSMIHDHD